MLAEIVPMERTEINLIWFKLLDKQLLRAEEGSQSDREERTGVCLAKAGSWVCEERRRNAIDKWCSFSVHNDSWSSVFHSQLRRRPTMMMISTESGVFSYKTLKPRPLIQLLTQICLWFINVGFNFWSILNWLLFICNHFITEYLVEILGLNSNKEWPKIFSKNSLLFIQLFEI